MPKPSNAIPPMQQPPKQPKTKTLTVTKEQIAGIKVRQQEINAATANLNTFLSGVVAGHGYDAVNVTAFDDAKRTVTIVIPA